MLIIVNYKDSQYQDEAQRIINKLCEEDKNVFIDLTERISVGSTAIVSLEFALLKKLFDTEIPSLNKNVVLDGNVLFMMMDNFDRFQRDFLFKQMSALGKVTAKIVDVQEDCDSFSFTYLVGKDFFVDFKKRLDKILKKIEESPIYILLRSIDAYGYYLGNCSIDDPPTKIVFLPGNAGQKISYDEYANWIMSEMPLREIEEKCVELEEKYLFVRQRHPVEILVKNAFKKQCENKQKGKKHE